MPGSFPSILDILEASGRRLATVVRQLLFVSAADTGQAYARINPITQKPRGQSSSNKLNCDPQRLASGRGGQSVSL